MPHQNLLVHMLKASMRVSLPGPGNWEQAPCTSFWKWCAVREKLTPSIGHR